MKKINLFILLLGIVAVYYSAQTVPEGETGVLYRFNAPVETPKHNLVTYPPGLHFVLPIVNKIRHFDLDTKTSIFKTATFSTAKAKSIQIEYYLEWNISDLKKYIQNNNSDNIPQPVTQLFEKKLEAICLNLDAITIATQQKQILTNLIQKDFIDKADEFGIKISSAGIMQIQDTNALTDAVLQHQEALYKQFINEYKLDDGNALANQIRAKTDIEVNSIITAAKTKSAQIRETANTQATGIYNNAYIQDKEFYLWHKSLETYAENFTNSNNILVLQPGGIFLKYLKEQKKIEITKKQ